jgi:hypothetical protein
MLPETIIAIIQAEMGIPNSTPTLMTHQVSPKADEASSFWTAVALAKPSSLTLKVFRNSTVCTRSEI